VDEAKRHTSVVITGLQEVDTTLANQVHDSVLFGEAAGPGTGSYKLEGFGLADAGERVAQDGFDEIEGTQSDLSVRIHPETEILTELWMEQGDSLGSITRRRFGSSCQGRAPAEGL
jgi:hypothetical protein